MVSGIKDNASFSNDHADTCSWVTSRIYFIYSGKNVKECMGVLSLVIKMNLVILPQ